MLKTKKFWRRFHMSHLNKIVSLLLLISLFLCIFPAKLANAGQEIDIFLWIGKKEIQINGEIKEIDVAPFIKDNRTFVPIRFVSEALGAKVNWVDSEKKVEIVLKDISISLWIDKYFAYVNGVEKKLDTAPMIVDSRTFVPVRFVSENLGASVGWDAHEQKVSIAMRFYDLSVPTPTQSWAPPAITPSPTPSQTRTSSWALSDSDINAALIKAKKFSSLNAFTTWLMKNPDFAKDLKGASYFASAVIETPFLQLIGLAVSKFERYEDFSFSQAKSNSSLFNHLDFFVFLYGSDIDFPKYLSAVLKLPDGTVLHPTSDTIPSLADLSTTWPYEPAYQASFWVSFDTAKIPYDGQVTLVIIDQAKGSQYTAEYDLKLIHVIERNP